ncbi:MAG: TonB-dependent receptor plug domain-containing protein [Thermoanaerobaculia bacterium]
MRPLRTTRIAGLLALASLLAGPAGASQEPGGAVAQATDLKKLSIEELMEIDVTSVSRRAERLNQAAAAIIVVTREDIRRSGVTSLPEALRLVNSLHVARQSQRSWAINARGSNTSTSNKLLVLIDGRSVYTPLFSGVFWDVQDTLLEDVERIEVIRGPGATLWGANAVNGIINVITKKAADTQGGLVTAGAGSEEKGFGGVRYGGTLGERGHYRAYGKYYDRDSLVLVDGSDAGDPIQMRQAGFRADWTSTERDAFTFQGDAYEGRVGETIRDDSDVDGGNLLGRWTRTLAEDSDLELQVYWDRTHRRIPALFEEHLDTLDLDLQHRFPLAGRHDVVWGLGYRWHHDRVGNSPGLAFLPARRDFDLFSLFAQDEVSLLDNRLALTVGTKLEHNDSTGLEVQPSVRAAWKASERRTLWAAVSRAVRTPARIDEDIFAFGPGGQVLLRGSRDFESEELIAWELGYRIQPHPEVLLDVAAFYNVYDDLRSQEPPANGAIPITLANKLAGETWGIELRSNLQPVPGWRLQVAYAWLDKELRLDPDSRDRTRGAGEGNDPEHRFTLRSGFDLSAGLELDGWLRYVSELPSPAVDDYTELDLRLGWRSAGGLELSLVGQNLLHESHAEFGPATALREEVERSLYGKVVWRF